MLEAWAQLRMSLTWNILLALQRLSFHLPRWWLEIIQQMFFLFSSANSQLVLHLTIFTLAHDHNYFVNSIKKRQLFCSCFKIQWCVFWNTNTTYCLKLGKMAFLQNQSFELMHCSVLALIYRIWIERTMMWEI